MSYAGPVDAGRLSGDRRTTYERRIGSPFTGIARVKGKNHPPKAKGKGAGDGKGDAEEEWEGGRPLDLSSALVSAAPFFAHR